MKLISILRSFEAYSGMSSRSAVSFPTISHSKTSSLISSSLAFIEISISLAMLLELLLNSFHIFWARIIFINHVFYIFDFEVHQQNSILLFDIWCYFRVFGTTLEYLVPLGATLRYLVELAFRNILVSKLCPNHRKCAQIPQVYPSSTSKHK